ncbi:MFS transporter [Paenibacillus alvei]|uniref:MFS transporter n=1 Tax=Paenibacillus alvei TaxID=44250 RepID=A0AAP6ZXG5_PAEAL|nr:MFS transporter [Paenibacillus alvei]MBG9734703.1 MFS transporter [Paenibacillus alvei]MBG9742986.1 MFS transporter [Paenibacillus alvei]MCY9582151.1 MFS transporter [Paenibacillus alvei]MCY9587621.1 MFS transporter [Paenibacillus alvei]NEZ44656.1 MFS transporter [Paenibacillus alvei]
MRSVFWLYLFLFVAFFDLHAQYPILTPFAISLGAAPSFIGLMMGMYSFTHLPGNVMAGYGVDRFGSRIFIVFSLIGAGIILMLQAHVVNPWQLLILRSISGFVLAFLSPACLSLLARMARDHVHQGKLMAGNGLVHTLASVVSPAAGAYLVSKIGFVMAFQALGIGLILVGAMAWLFIRDVQENSFSKTTTPSVPTSTIAPSPAIPWRFYFMPLAIACSQGILFFELPFMTDALTSIMKTGVLFSAVSLGALLTLSMLFLNQYSAYMRTWIGSFSLALLFFVLAVHWPVPLLVTLFLIGMTKGIILPALSAHLLLLSGGARYGRIFSILSIASSIGSFIGPMVAGQLRGHVSPYFIAFLVLMLAVTLLPPGKQTTIGKPIHSSRPPTTRPTI